MCLFLQTEGVNYRLHFFCSGFKEMMIMHSGTWYHDTNYPGERERPGCYCGPCSYLYVHCLRLCRFCRGLTWRGGAAAAEALEEEEVSSSSSGLKCCPKFVGQGLIFRSWTSENLTADLLSASMRLVEGCYVIIIIQQGWHMWCSKQWSF